MQLLAPAFWKSINPSLLGVECSEEQLFVALRALLLHFLPEIRRFL